MLSLSSIWYIGELATDPMSVLHFDCIADQILLEWPEP